MPTVWCWTASWLCWLQQQYWHQSVDQILDQDCMLHRQPHQAKQTSYQYWHILFQIWNFVRYWPIPMQQRFHWLS